MSLRFCSAFDSRPSEAPMIATAAAALSSSFLVGTSLMHCRAIAPTSSMISLAIWSFVIMPLPLLAHEDALAVDRWHLGEPFPLHDDLDAALAQHFAFSEPRKIAPGQRDLMVAPR